MRNPTFSTSIHSEVERPDVRTVATRIWDRLSTRRTVPRFWSARSRVIRREKPPRPFTSGHARGLWLPIVAVTSTRGREYHLAAPTWNAGALPGCRPGRAAVPAASPASKPRGQTGWFHERALSLPPGQFTAVPSLQVPSSITRTHGNHNRVRLASNAFDSHHDSATTSTGRTQVRRTPPRPNERSQRPTVG